jgi:hypothetical protein
MQRLRDSKVTPVARMEEGGAKGRRWFIRQDRSEKILHWKGNGSWSGSEHFLPSEGR